MIKSIEDYLESAYAPTVVKARNSIVKGFARFCFHYHHEFFPATEDSLLEYATFLANSGLKASTISKYISTIGIYNKLHGVELSTSTFRLNLVLRGIKRSQNFQPSSKAPLTPLELRAIRNTLDWNSSRDRCFWACLVISFWTFLRGGNLVPKSKNDFSPDRHLSATNLLVDGKSGTATFNLKKTKTIQFNEWILVIPLMRLDDNFLCPIDALSELWKLCPLQSTGSIFSYMENGVIKPLLHAKLNELIKYHCELAGLNPRIYSAHSLRKGGTTIALMSGVDEIIVKAQGNWISNAYKRYITFSLDQRLSVARSIDQAMSLTDFFSHCHSLAMPLAAGLFNLGA